MQHYRLLRNNKESGPYTWKELADLPLKPYDLVWADGKSAAWRYPSELPEFKELAPAVEEDFYQVFHTRPAEQKTTETSSSKSFPISVQPPVETTDLPPHDTSHKKYVTVILPETTSSPKREPVLRVVSPSPKVQPVLEEVLLEPAIEPMEEQGPSAQTIRRPSRVPYGLSLVSLVVFVSLAVFFGFRWFAGSAGSTTPASSEQTTTLPVLQTLVTETTEDVPTLPANPALEFAALKRYLTITPAQINVGIFGGINRLQLTIQNTHNQPIESIRIAVDFLEKDQSLHHTEFVDIPVVEAKSSLTVKVPANGSGRAIQTRILGIGQYSN